MSNLPVNRSEPEALDRTVEAADLSPLAVRTRVVYKAVVRNESKTKRSFGMKIKMVMFAIFCVFLLVPSFASAAAANGNVGYGEATPGRIWASLDAVLGLIGAILGGLSLARSAGRFGKGSGRRGAIVSAVVGLIVIAYALLHLTIFTGDFGTGSGRAGAIIAIVVGLVSIVLAGLTLARTRHSG